MPIPDEWPAFWADKFVPGMLVDFIHAGDLVFDIGGNVGKMAWLYRTLGARVLTVEPQAACAALLRGTFMEDSGVTVVQVACGASPGTAQMACYGGTTISTLVPDHYWRKGGPWSGTPLDWVEDVEIVTLDSLIDVYGMPAFIKIDVEGYEHQVLQGLSRFVPLSFEFHPCFAEQADLCMSRILELEPGAEFCDTFDERLIPAVGWFGRDELNARITALYRKHGNDYFGNIYARKAAN